MYTTESAETDRSGVDAVVPGAPGDARFAAALRSAIHHEELCLHYQPRLDLASGRTTLLEALVRWDKPGAGLLYPTLFIDPAVSHGLIFSLDLWVFEQCCRDLLWLRGRHDDAIRLSVNITSVECESLYHTQKLIEICNAYGLTLRDFEFEITESTWTREPGRLKAFCDTITEMGSTLSLDDFGTGHSPLANLCRLPVSTIKLDRSMVQKTCQHGREEILVRHLIRMAHEMEIRVVGEGIENTEQFEHLQALGCDQLQGFHISRPLARERILAHLRDGR